MRDKEALYSACFVIFNAVPHNDSVENVQSNFSSDCINFRLIFVHLYKNYKNVKKIKEKEFF